MILLLPSSLPTGPYSVASVSSLAPSLARPFFNPHSGSGHQSQLALHNRFGGVLLPLAQKQHADSIDRVVQDAFDQAQLEPHQLSHIAVTTRPGLIPSLRIGALKAASLARTAQRTLIPVHHMRAHALTGRFCSPHLRFPFLSLLISGGHCLLVLVQGPDQFALLGSSRDFAPGRLFDRAARRLQLRFQQPDYADISGGRLLEMAADGGDPHFLPFRSPLTDQSVDFRFAPLLSRFEQRVAELEAEEGIRGLGYSARLPDVAASLQHAVFHHVARRLCRAVEVLRDEDIHFGDALVFAGGCAANSYLRKGLAYVAAEYGLQTVVPPPWLCGDNGAMIAWTGVEMLGERGAHSDMLQWTELPNDKDWWMEWKEPIGEDWGDRIAKKKWTIQSQIQLNDPSLFL